MNQQVLQELDQAATYATQQRPILQAIAESGPEAAVQQLVALGAPWTRETATKEVHELCRVAAFLELGRQAGLVERETIDRMEHLAEVSEQLSRHYLKVLQARKDDQAPPAIREAARSIMDAVTETMRLLKQTPPPAEADGDAS